MIQSINSWLIANNWDPTKPLESLVLCKSEDIEMNLFWQLDLSTSKWSIVISL